MKITVWTSVVLVFGSLALSPALATTPAPDHERMYPNRSMMNEEALAAQRDAMRQLSVEERAIVRAARQAENRANAPLIEPGKQGQYRANRGSNSGTQGGQGRRWQQ